MRVSLRRAAVVAALAAPVALAAGQDVLSQLGVTTAAAREAIGSVLTSGVYDPGLPAKMFKAMTPAARAQAATAGVAWLKAYTASPEFKTQYAELRQNRKPSPPAFDATPEQEMQKVDAESKQQLEESKKAIAALPPEQRKAMEEALRNAAEMTAKLETGDMRKMRLDGIKAERASQAKEYDEALAKWKTDYPEDPRPVIAARLREFLALSADVDFNAKLKGAGTGATFENPAYQSKSSQWKTCYRAGREATAAARAAVQAWLSQLGG